MLTSDLISHFDCNDEKFLKLLKKNKIPNKENIQAEELINYEESLKKLFVPSQIKNQSLSVLEDNQKFTSENNNEDQNPLQETETPNPAEDLDNDSEDEGLEDYKLGGYHPVHIGEVLIQRYVIIQKLGWGHFSTVWLCKDFKYNNYVAIKIQKSAPHYMEAAYDEVEILQKVAKNLENPKWFEDLKNYHKDENKKRFSREDCPVVQLLNSFVYLGPYGNHFCMVFEILGVNLLEIIKRYNYKGIPMPLCRNIAKQVLIGLDFLHRYCGVIHTDLKPENVLLCLTDKEIKEIVEEGSLKQAEQFQVRIKEFQKKHGIYIEEKSIVSNTKREEENKNFEIKNETEKVNNSHLTKNQKKKLQKKKKKQQKKEQLLRQEQENKKMEFDSQVKAEIKIENNADINVAANPENNNKYSKIKFDNWNGRGSRIDENVKIKIADLGNACWIHHHFATEIQTRQYRSPEVILGVHYNTTADLWSLACMIFEMLTGDFLFEPRKGPNFSKDDDHLAQIEEITSKFSKKFSLSGTRSKKFIDSNGNLKRIPTLHYWSLFKVLTNKYHMTEKEALAFSNFISPMLKHNPAERISAKESLQNKWLKMEPNYDFKMNEEEYTEFITNQELSKNENSEGEDEKESMIVDSDVHDADGENTFDQSVEEEASPLPDFDRRFLDRSFANQRYGYIGFGDGIQLEELDCQGNWQFDY